MECCNDVFSVFFLDGPANQVCIDKEIDCNGRQYLMIYIPDHVPDIMVIRILRVFDGMTDCLALGRELTFAEFIRPIHQNPHVLFGLLVKRYFMACSIQISSVLRLRSYVFILLLLV